MPWSTSVTASTSQSFSIGDGAAMAYRVGAELVDLEFNQYYGTDVIWPPSVKGTIFLYELMIPDFVDGEITDKDGNPIIDKPLPIRDDAIKIIFNVIKEGRRTEHGGVYYDTTKSPKTEEEISQVFKDMTPKHYRFLRDAAGIDAVEVSGGTFLSGPKVPFRREITFERDQAYFRKAARALKKMSKLPVILVGGIRSYLLAERLVSEGIMDYISMCRPLIREPILIKRWQSGDLRKATCISCNGCFGPARAGRGILCVQDIQWKP